MSELEIMDKDRRETAMESTDTALAEAPAEDVVQANGNVLRRHIKEDPRKRLLAKHRLWMESLQHEYPLPFRPFKIGVYIRYYNQTKYSNYLDKHIAQFRDDIALCPHWTLVDFYIDKGMNAPRMENAKEWCRLLGDCFSGKVDLIVTQKVSNVSNDADEMAFVARLLAAQKPPVGIYFISEDIFTLASYYRHDLLDRGMFPAGHEPLPVDELDAPMIYEGERPALAGSGMDSADESGTTYETEGSGEAGEQDSKSASQEDSQEQKDGEHEDSDGMIPDTTGTGDKADG